MQSHNKGDLFHGHDRSRHLIASLLHHHFCGFLYQSLLAIHELFSTYQTFEMHAQKPPSHTLVGRYPFAPLNQASHKQPLVDLLYSGFARSAFPFSFPI
ncbi:hypothetical protein LguiA_003035 [Lonicera macranthoides]